jgi:hypothetical protein
MMMFCFTFTFGILESYDNTRIPFVRFLRPIFSSKLRSFIEAYICLQSETIYIYIYVMSKYIYTYIYRRRGTESVYVRERATVQFT